MEMNSNGYEIILSEKVMSIFEKYKEEYSYEIETGGILIGKVEDVCKRIYVADLTEPFDGDKRTRCRYVRAEKGHQQYMDDVWERSGHTLTYLGEWHTHNQNVIFASPVDYSNWLKISNKNHNADILIFIILGRNDLAIWTSKNGSIEKIK